ncbi:hypothetical protein BLIC_b01722 [Bifidobacterium longum subsp. infantis]|uniref:Transposase n=1 Tax=Bifidobacterium longum subsp. infantis TaxID=1682 RepID=A0ABM9R5N0_BIFLI|nr:hypothetical protein BLIC_a01712 [Bifidobacterium longum subsp. infantis]CEF01919.1 hypothetical protein BLIC_b01722 [Bifidobacterium longum subsp. infantis]CEF03135.1 hypothetical protein BLIC_c01717 [Bifidobacterium longum subsp. infantis]CEF07964.1 hypothetical protein BLIC_e01735 [Bifidobacterium longum subsp. infantis]CEF10538.1 hypothetical protein BLIC_g01707 [Bifidobacterium longum subsp. infantis]
MLSSSGASSTSCANWTEMRLRSRHNAVESMFQIFNVRLSKAQSQILLPARFANAVRLLMPGV